MARIVLVTAITFLIAGCEVAGEKGGLSKKQKAAWAEKRKEVADYPFIIVGYDADEKAWMCYVRTDVGLNRYGWKQTVLELWDKDQKDGAIHYAKQAADDSRIVAVALVDLTSEAQPKAVGWYFKDGDNLKRAKSAPRADLGVSLQEFLMTIQTNPGMVKIPTS